MDLQGQVGFIDTYRRPARTRGVSAWLVAGALVAFYLALYFEDAWAPAIGRPLTVASRALGLPSRWFLYGALYTVAMIAGGARYLRHHGNARYHRVRIAVNVLVQVSLAFAVPYVLQALGERDYYFSYLWPLRIEWLYADELAKLPVVVAAYAVLASLVLAPWLALRFGKRWYCSWICGCGGLANTFGDPYRHLSDKSTRAHRFERVSVHAVLAIAVGATLLVAADFFFGRELVALHQVAGPVRRVYGFFVGAVLAGVVGVGVYPLLGPRVWCRYFCPMAALLGLVQKAGRFRIRVKHDTCISCGNCSTYCEMGIDVRAYAQRNESFTRASCVGCGMCAHVCPRGVLRLENESPRTARRRLPLVPAPPS